MPSMPRRSAFTPAALSQIRPLAREVTISRNHQEALPHVGTKAVGEDGVVLDAGKRRIGIAPRLLTGGGVHPREKDGTQDAPRGDEHRIVRGGRLGRLRLVSSPEAT
jgi:hypothetical protein